MTSKTFDTTERRFNQLESATTVQVQYQDGETTTVTRIPLKRVVFALLEHLELELDGKPSILRKTGDK